MSKFTKKIASGVMASAIGLAALMPTSAHAGPDPFLGEIMMVGFDFCPRGWLQTNGQLLQIAQNTALFSLLGTTYGGDGRTTFGLPDLRGRNALHVGNGPGLAPVTWGQEGGRENVTLTQNELPSHTHTMNANKLESDKGGPDGKVLGGGGEAKKYNEGPTDRVMRADTIGNTGSNQAFNIQNPFQGVYHCIATVGVFPSRS